MLRITENRPYSPSSRLSIRTGLQMDPASCPVPCAGILHCSSELSKNSCRLAIQFPDRPQPSLYAIEGRNTEKLMAKLTAA
jgi:hypothetical protein